MKMLLCMTLTLIAASGIAFSDQRSFRRSLEEIPPKYMGDLPLADRGKFLRALDSEGARLDAEKGWLHWYSDGGDVRITSMVWAKELPRPGKSPLVFVHMAKPFANSGNKPSTDQTFVLERDGKEWVDVTKKVIPSTVDMTMHFRTRKNDTVIEVARWRGFERQDGRGNAWDFGERISDLRWTGEAFEVDKAAAKKLTNN
jgi:hypothetical protein